MVPYANCTSMSGCVRVISCSKEAGHNLEGGGGGGGAYPPPLERTSKCIAIV